MNLTEASAWAHGAVYLLSKAERRRQRRGVGLPTTPILVENHGGRVFVLLVDGSVWRLYFRGGKTFRRPMRMKVRR
jgi:hypothetical protein